MEKRVVFGHKTLPYLLLAPQLIITVVFFFLPPGRQCGNPCASKTLSAYRPNSSA